MMREITIGLRFRFEDAVVSEHLIRERVAQFLDGSIRPGLEAEIETPAVRDRGAPEEIPGFVRTGPVPGTTTVP